MIHEDDRRVLLSQPYKDGEIKTISAKKDCILGNHYHLKKLEVFTAITEGISIERDGEAEMMKTNTPYEINPGVKHSFGVPENGLLMCVCSNKYDPNDDYQ